MPVDNKVLNQQEDKNEPEGEDFPGRNGGNKAGDNNMEIPSPTSAGMIF